MLTVMNAGLGGTQSYFSETVTGPGLESRWPPPANEIVAAGELALAVAATSARASDAMRTTTGTSLRTPKRALRILSSSGSMWGVVKTAAPEERGRRADDPPLSDYPRPSPAPPARPSLEIPLPSCP